MAKALVLFATRSGQTQSIAEYIAEGIRFTGNQADLRNAAQVKKAEEIDGYDAYVIGSPTYHGEMIQGIKNVLFIASNASLEGKVGGAFGAFGWSGEAVDRIYETMEKVFNMDMVGTPLRLKSADIQGGMQMAQDYGKQVGRKIGGE
jgi:flavorubredoxin